MFPQPYFAKGYWPGAYFPPTGEPPPEGAMWATVAGTGAIGGAVSAAAWLRAELDGLSSLHGVVSGSGSPSPTTRRLYFSSPDPRRRVGLTVELRAAISGRGTVAGKISWLVDDTDEALWLLMD